MTCRKIECQQLRRILLQHVKASEVELGDSIVAFIVMLCHEVSR